MSAPERPGDGGVRLPRGGIVLVNWNGWGDTVECLEAVFRMEGFDGPVVVCDNGSEDMSLSRIAAWAEGSLSALPESRDPAIRDLFAGSVHKPIGVTHGRPGEPGAVDHVAQAIRRGARLVLLDIGENLGFAGANNVGLRFLQRVSDVDWFWLLNNDALPDRRAYRELAQSFAVVPPRCITGSLLLEYWSPNFVQACGGRYSRYTALSSHRGEGLPAASTKDWPAQVACDYPVGAALAIDRAFLAQVGNMSEDYFLYAEEIDWVVRDGWPSRAFVTARSIVYHKGGSSTGAGRRPRHKSLISDYYQIRGRLLLARRGGLRYLLPVLLVSLVTLCRRVFRPKRGALKNAFAAVLHGLLGRTGR